MIYQGMQQFCTTSNHLFPLQWMARPQMNHFEPLSAGVQIVALMILAGR